MSRLSASLAGMIIIAGVLYRPAVPASLLPIGAELNSSPAGSIEKSSAPNKGPASGSDTNQGATGVCVEEDGPWTAVEKSFQVTGLGPGNVKPFAQDWNKAKRAGEVAGDTAAIIATVPDPAHTRLALYFDRSIDSIVEAGLETGYSLDRYWLPWRDTPPEAEPDCSFRLAEKHERLHKETEPGLLLFRRAEKDAPAARLLVFLVGESPIYGISKVQFSNAVQHIREAWGNPKQCAIGIAGPTFSSSVPSVELATQTQDPKSVSFRISSGSITDSKAVQELRAGFGCAQADSQDCRFGTTLEDDARAFTDFVRYLWFESGVPVRGVALVTESETTYGLHLFEPEFFRRRNSRDTHLPDISPLDFQFPREISRLREAYVATPGIGNSSSDSNSIPRQLLPLNLKDAPLFEEDVPPSFSKQQTPLWQELELASLAAELERHDIQYLGLTATDPLDILFLIQFFQRAKPDVQLFTLDADLLFLRAQDQVPPEGLLTVTSYPLFVHNRDWLRTRLGLEDSQVAVPENHRLFPSRYAEAMYNASLLLLGQRAKVLDSEPPDALGLGSHAKTETSESTLDIKPPLWLMVVGNEGYSPVSVLDTPMPRSERQGSERLPRAWLLVWGAVSLFSVLHILGCWVAQFWNHRRLEVFRLIDRDVRVREIIADILASRHRRFVLPRAMVLLVATLSLLVLQAILLLPAQRLYQLSSWTEAFAIAIGTLLIMTAIALSALVLKLAGEALRQQWGGVLLAAVSWAVSAWFCLWWWRSATAGDYYGVFFSYRSVQLDSGVSPALPLLFLFACVYVWSWTHLDRLAMASGRPLVIARDVDDRFKTMEREAQAGVELLVYSRKLQALLAFFFVCGVLLARPSHRFASFENYRFGIWYQALLIFLYWLIFSNWARFWYVWSRLKSILRRLEQLPIRGAFSRLPSQFSSSPIWQQGGKRRPYEALTRAVDCLASLASETDDPELRDRLATIREEVQVILANEACQRSPGTANLDVLQKSIKETGELIASRYLKTPWESGASESLDAEEKANLTEESREKGFLGEKVRILAEEFLALRYVAFIWYVTIQMRYLLFFISAGFILSLISLKSYPFQAHHAIGWIMTAVFLVLGAGVVKVYAEMERDAVLSRLSATEPGKLGKDFFVRVASFGALPLFTVIAAQVPSVSRFFFSWIQPSLQALK
ncbi:MAG TPA: hypothetical protein VI455_16985 [Terriglobia bacterium]